MESKIKKVINEKGITLIALTVTVIVVLILASLSISMLLGDRGILSEAKESKSNAERSSIESKIDLSILKAKQKNKNVTLDKIIKQLIVDNVITNEDQVEKENGTITTDSGEVFTEKLKDYVGK